ncbi:DUF6517 family protein [Halalkalicoccus sp. NIPERK01]|uniref:DUF6517 family protein n=1 Tax=Halalkalicoccus sp. NIPERK01 TaxID=3053469 RepID=UPI00256ECD9E|nr:DUF6517 family protein [Halalkalicoccus sp. NIPERK01]MDL5362812.1 DUF6517 family protein [Halalkalicoccus sp. NIPERK01]
MKMTRRAFGGLVAGTAAATAGCMEAATGDGPLTFEATEIRASETAVEDTGYDHRTTETVPFTKEFEVGGVSREVRADTVVSKYDKAIDMGPLGSQRSALFVVASTPKAEVGGRTFNPIEDMDNRELAEEFQSRYGEVTIRDEISTEVISVLDEDVDLSTFEAETELEGQPIDVRLHLGVAETDDDLVVLLGGHPRRITDEEANIVTLAESVEPID